MVGNFALIEVDVDACSQISVCKYLEWFDSHTPYIHLVLSQDYQSRSFFGNSRRTHKEACCILPLTPIWILMGFPLILFM